MTISLDDFVLDGCLQLINELLMENKKRALADVERSVIVGSWQDKTYQEIADEALYEISYIRGDVGCNLWKILSQILGVRVTKKNFRTQLQLYRNACREHSQSGEQPTSDPERVIFRGTPVYVDRHPIERKYVQEILEPGSLLRIRAPQKMGKTLLLEKVIQSGMRQGYQSVTLDFRLVEKPILQDLKSFLQWLCVNVAEELELEAQLEQNWSDTRGLISNFKYFFESYLLPQLDVPLILGLDNVDILFDEHEVCEEFFKVLRWIHESAKRHGRSAVTWQQLRLVVVYSTQNYPKNDLNHSPFNVGFARELPPFSLNQSQDCARGYGLDTETDLAFQEFKQLHTLVAGHPYLIQESLAYIREHGLCFSAFMGISTTNKSPFRAYLSAILTSLKRNHELSEVFKSVLVSSTPVHLNSPYDFQLESMGLIKLEVEGVKIANELYAQFFKTHQVEL